MGSLHEFSAEFHISLAKARRMEKRGWLRIDSDATPLDEIRLALKKGARLTVAQLVELIENPGGLLELRTYARQAEAQLAVLGNPKSDAAPFDQVAVHILDAYRNDAEAVGIIATWVASILPAGPVGHAFVATRLLLGVPADMRKYDVPRLQRVLMNCRAHPALAGHWRTVKQASRNVTYYHKQSLDL